MSTIRRSTRRPTPEVSEAVLQYLEDGGPAADFETFRLAADEGKLRATWRRSRADLLARWATETPGRRPWAWWRFDAPGPRQRLGGTGTPRCEVLAVAPCVQFGVELDYVDAEDVELYNGRLRDVHGRLILPDFAHEPFVADAYDPGDPPAYESQAAFLKRHGLLTAAERRRLTARDFEPEQIEDTLSEHRR